MLNAVAGLSATAFRSADMGKGCGLIAEILNQPLQQAVTQLAMSDSAVFDQSIHGLLDVVAAPDADPGQVVHALKLVKLVKRRVTFNPYLSVRLVTALLEIGDAEAAGDVGLQALQENDFEPELNLTLAVLTVRAFLAIGASNDPRLDSLKNLWPQCPVGSVNTHDGPIRVGFVAADFPHTGEQWHPAVLIPNIVSPEFQIFAYGVGANSLDASVLAERLRLPYEQSRALGGQDAGSIIDTIRADALDILIDLDQMQDAMARAIVLARPAPTMILWQRHPVAPGLQPHDFILAGESILSSDARYLYRERILSLPDIFYTTDPRPALPPTLPAADTAHFGVLCQPERISQHCLQIWAAILAALPETRLIFLLSGDRAAGQAAYLADRMQESGLPVERVTFRSATNDAAHDLAGMSVVLDSFPANDPEGCYRAVIAGIPVVTATGDMPANRASAAILTQIGLGALVMSDAASYAELAVALVSQSLQDRIALGALVQGGCGEALARATTPLITQLHTHLQHVHALATQIENVGPEDAIRFLSQCEDALFELALHKLMYQYLGNDNPKLKIRALKIACGVAERVINFPIPTLNLLAALVSVSDYETAGNIGYLAYSTTKSDVFRRNLRHTTLFALAAGTDVDSRRVDELAIAKGRFELLPALKPRWRPQPAAGRRIRVGYVFSFFHLAAYHVHTRPVLELYDRDGFDVFIYGLGEFDTDAGQLSARLNLPIDRVRALGGLSDHAAADIIRQDNIDVLVELDGFSNVRRDGVFQQRPAAINALWYNTPYTLGIDLYDFVIADPIVLPPEEKSTYSEEIVYLPHSVYSWMTQGELPPVADAPCGQNGYITFGSFNRMDKLSMQCLESWGEILRRVPTAKLILHYPTLRHEEIRLWQSHRMIQAGLPMDRVTLRVGGTAMIDWQTFMSSYGTIDIGLDPYPYCGGHTSYDTVCMGVPLVCFPGKRYPSRISASIVTACDLPDLVAPDRDGYIEMAVRLAQETPEQLTARRHDIRRRVLGSPFRRWPEFVRSLEGLYRYMVDRAQAWPERQQ